MPDAGLMEELGAGAEDEDELPAAAGLVESEVLPPQAAVDRARPVTAANRTRVRFMAGSFRDGAGRGLLLLDRWVHMAVTVTECQPVAPSGLGGRRAPGWVSPSASVERTSSRWTPGVASQLQAHCRQVSMLGTAASRASCQSSPSTRTCTAWIP